MKATPSDKINSSLVHWNDDLRVGSNNQNTIKDEWMASVTPAYNTLKALKAPIAITRQPGKGSGLNHKAFDRRIFKPMNKAWIENKRRIGDGP